MNANLKAKPPTGVMAPMIVVAVIAATAITALAIDMPGPQHAWQEKGMDRLHRWAPVLGVWRNPQLVEKLALTDEQVSKLRETDFSVQEEHLEARAQLDRLKLQMDEAFSQDNIDQSAVRQLARQMADVKGRLLVQDVESRLAVGQILNADQIGMLRQHEMQQGSKGPKRGDKRDGRRHLEQR
jgi:Spy/CpxP family protein refolding chaperone